MGKHRSPDVRRLLQAAADVAFISIIVFATGLYDSVFSFMFVIVILLGSLERYLRGAVGWALLSSAAYTVLVYLQMRGILLPPGFEATSVSFSQFARSAVTNSTAFLLTGVLSGLLGEEIRKGKEKVRDRDDVIRKLESFHKHVIDNIPSGLLTIDTQGKVNLVNDTACAILGKTREDTVGKPMGQVLAGIEGWEAREGRDDSRIPRAEIRFLRADGTEVYLGFSTSPMKDAEGRSIGRVVIFQDLTPIRQMEERVRIADRLAGVGELAAGLAHEIRNPLASIAGSSQLLRESAASSGESATLLDIIGRESQRLNGLITDFLAYTGPSQRNTTRLDVAALLRDVAEAVRAGEAREKGVEVELAPLNAAHGGRGRRAVEAGGVEPRPQRGAGRSGGGKGDDRRLRTDPPRVPVRRRDGGRHRGRDRPGDPRKDLQPVLHDQGGGDGARSLHLPADRSPAQGVHRGSPGARKGMRLLGVPPGGVGKERGGERRG